MQVDEEEEGEEEEEEEVEEEAGPSRRRRGAVKGQSDGKWAAKQRKMSKGAGSTTEVKEKWQTGKVERPWLVSAGEAGGRYRAKCLACGCIFDSKLTGIEGHEKAAKHKAACGGSSPHRVRSMGPSRTSACSQPWPT